MSRYIHRHFDPKLSVPIPDTALIAEGGGQRGIFTAGVLDAWLDMHFNPFSLLIGTSAGAQNLSSYITGQQGFAQKTIFELSRDKHFFDLKRPFTGGNTVDLDWFFEQTQQPNYMLNISQGMKNLSQRQILFTATRIKDYQARYFSPDSQNWLTLLKASSALPFLYKQGVEIDNEYHLDGGLAAPLPVEEAYNRGARKIIVIRTTPQGSNACTPWLHRLRGWLKQHHANVKLVDYYAHHEKVYQRAEKFIQNPPSDLIITQIFPTSELASNLIGSTKIQLEHDYLSGKEIGRQLLLSDKLDFLFTQADNSADSSIMSNSVMQLDPANKSLNENVKLEV